MSKLAVFEIFNTLNTITDKTARRESLKTIPDSIKQILYYWLNDKAVSPLPEGDPPYTPANAINTHNALWGDIRRLRIFISGMGYDQLSSNRREHLFVEYLENIHPEDAKLILNMKNKVWPYETFTKEDVREVFPAIFE